jgi:RimJ/RimL family protein N-acetyltransferase
VTAAVARAVVDGAEIPLGPLTAAPGWPHTDTADALRPHAEHGNGGEAYGTFLVVVDGQVIGDCGWFGPPDDAGDVEIGYGLAASARGRGLGSEAVALLCAWVERQPGVRQVTAEVLAGNEPSRRLLTRLGFAEEPAQPPYVRFVRDVAHMDAG